MAQKPPRANYLNRGGERRMRGAPRHGFFQAGLKSAQVSVRDAI